MKRILLLSVVMLLGLYATGFATDPCATRVTFYQWNEEPECFGGQCSGSLTFVALYDCGEHELCPGSETCDVVFESEAQIEYLEYDYTGSCDEPDDCSAQGPPVDVSYWEYDCVCS